MSIESEEYVHPPNRPAPATQRGLITAVVRVAGRDFRYRRAGSGPPLLLLLATPPEAEDPMLEALASRFLVIVPEPVPVGDRADPIAFPVWLDGLVEGLGLEGPRLLLEPSTADSLPGVLRIG